MDSLSDLLSQRSPETPPEVTAIKQYVYDTHNSTVGVQVKDREIIILVSSAALASRLRYDMPAIKTAAATDKRIVLRINN